MSENRTDRKDLKNSFKLKILKRPRFYHEYFMHEKVSIIDIWNEMIRYLKSLALEFPLFLIMPRKHRNFISLTLKNLVWCVASSRSLLSLSFQTISTTWILWWIYELDLRWIQKKNSMSCPALCSSASSNLNIYHF